jgi:hypothetical protein
MKLIKKRIKITSPLSSFYKGFNMKKRFNEEKNQLLLNSTQFNIYKNLEKELKKYLKILNYLLKTKSIPYTLMILNTTHECIDKLKKHIRSTDILLKIPNIQNHYIIILQNTDTNRAITLGSRISSLIQREFMINEQNFYNQIKIFGIEKEPIKSYKLAYEIALNIDEKPTNKEQNLWEVIKKY